MKEYSWQCTYINKMMIPDDEIVNGDTPFQEWLDYKPDISEHEKLFQDFFENDSGKVMKYEELLPIVEEQYRAVLLQPNRDANHISCYWKIIWMYDQLVKKLIKEKE